MLGRLRRWLTFANVCSFLALTIALGTGSAYAANTVFSTDIVDNDVRSADLRDGDVKYVDIGGNQVTTTKIKAGNVGNTDLASNAVDSSKVVQNSLTTADLVGADSSGAISIAAGSVANGRCKQFSVATPGAVANQGVIITARAALQDGVTISGQRVPSADTVTMNVCNLSGTTMDALSSFPIRTITFG